MLTDKQYNKFLKFTPVFISDHRQIIKKLENLENILNKVYPNFLIAYSFKTNYKYAKSRFIKKTNLLAEVVSEREYLIAKKNGFKNEKIIFNGPYKKNLSTLVKNNVNLNIDNFSELNSLIERNFNGKIGLRVNINIKGMDQSRFGFNIENSEAEQAIELIKRSKLKLVGIHCHLGTNINSLYAYKKMAQKISLFVNELEKKHNISIKSIDLGGGFPSSSYLPNSYKNKPESIENILKIITSEIKNNINSKKLPTLILEPGRYLIDDATLFFTKVIDIKINNQIQKITTDATINMIPSIWYKPQKIKKLAKTKQKKVKSIVYGSSCQENDILYKGNFWICKKNDILVFYSMGAYNASMAPSFIFDKPNEIMI